MFWWNSTVYLAKSECQLLTYSFLLTSSCWFSHQLIQQTWPTLNSTVGKAINEQFLPLLRRELRELQYISVKVGDVTLGNTVSESVEFVWLFCAALNNRLLSKMKQVSSVCGGMSLVFLLPCWNTWNSGNASVFRAYASFIWYTGCSSHIIPSQSVWIIVSCKYCAKNFFRKGSEFFFCPFLHYEH